MSQYKDISFWKRNLGHLPVRLMPAINDKFILMNGVSGNFCLHISNDEEDKNTYFSQAWSSNTKNFLLIKDNNAKLYNWHKDNKIEDISLQDIGNNLDKFYNYLVARSYQSEKDVIPVIIDIFKQFRTLTSEYRNPVHALNLLFILLASIEDGDVNTLDREKWGISEINIPPNFDAFIERFNQNTGGVTPDLNLILRHSAGALFQEAQKEVIFFDTQMELFGTFSGTLAAKKLIYSSIHYTPSYLARSIVENTLRTLNLEELEEIKILDPACGSAEFLIEVLKQLKEKNYQGKVEIQGYDRSETAISTALFLLNHEKRTVWRENLSFRVKKVEDSLIEEWEDNYTIILMNPPFVSWEQLREKNSRDAIRFVLNENFSGKPNQASAFFYKAVKHLADGGALGSVVPSSLFTMDAYSKLRNEVNEIINIELLGKLGNFVFEDALTDVSIFIGRKPNNPDSVPVLLWTRNEKGVVQQALRELRKTQYSNEYSKSRIDYSIFKPDRFPYIPDSWKPVSLKELTLIKNLKVHVTANKLCTIGDIFDVKQGVRPGNKKVFIISEEEYLQLPNDEQHYFHPTIDNNSIKSGAIISTNYVWYPYDIKNGNNLINTENELRSKTPIYFERYLHHQKEKLQSRKKEVPFWWSLSDRAPRLLPLSPGIVSTEFGNSSSFAFDAKGAFMVERGYAWKNKQKMDKDDFYFYLSLFSSPFFDKLLSIYSKQLAGGRWYDLGKKHTREIPIPNIYTNDIKYNSTYTKMVELGKHLSEGDIYVKTILDDVVTFFYP